MILTLALLLAPCTPVAVPAAAIPTAVIDEELDKKIAAAGDDVDELWKIRLWLIEQERTSESRQVLERILEIDPNHEDAHKALSHHFYDGKWFTSYAELSAYRREEEKRMKEQGLVRFRDGWAPEADVPFLKLGWEKQDDGEWISKARLERLADDAQKEAEGWVRQGLTWISPDEAENIQAGLFKCGDKWLSKDEANAYHSEIGQWWEYPTQHFVALSTLDDTSTTWVGYWAENAYGDLVRIFGVEPEERPEFIAFKNIEQFNSFAAGENNVRPQMETDGFSSLHYAFFADAFADPTTNPATYRGCGVAYWDNQDPNLSGFGRPAIRHAAAQSYVEAIDPSWVCLSKILTGEKGFNPTDEFWAEKRVPRWLRYGAASYVERYYVDQWAGDGGDPLAVRQWGLANLESKGGLRSLPKLFEFPLDLNDIEGSTQYLRESGAVVAFLLDGDCAPVQQAHAAFKEALAAGEDTSTAVQALQAALVENEAKLRAFIRP